MPMTVENYTNNNDILEFVKEYSAKDILKSLNFKKWEYYLLFLDKHNCENHLNLVFKENNDILGLVAINILNGTGIVYSIILKSKDLFSKINVIIEDKIKELGCSVIEYKITAGQSELLKETNSNEFKEHSIRMEKTLKKRR